nr:hypothetical protein CFP56_22003 [Quercus suber]
MQQNSTSLYFTRFRLRGATEPGDPDGRSRSARSWEVLCSPRLTIFLRIVIARSCHMHSIPPIPASHTDDRRASGNIVNYRAISTNGCMYSYSRKISSFGSATARSELLSHMKRSQSIDRTPLAIRILSASVYCCVVAHG